MLAIALLAVMSIGGSTMANVRSRPRLPAPMKVLVTSASKPLVEYRATVTSSLPVMPGDLGPNQPQNRAYATARAAALVGGAASACSTEPWHRRQRTGNGSFGPFVQIENSGFHTTRLVFAHDFDHDGIPDLAVSGSPIMAFRGAATSPFAEQHSIPVVREALQLEACDVNGDGTADLVTRFSDGAMLYPEVAAWQFASPFILASGTKSITPGFWVADLNGDGIPDIMVRRQSTFIWFVSDP